MLIECKYYDVAAKENEELLEKIAEESENLSEEELQLENDRRDFQLAEIIELSYGISWILSDSPKMCKKTMAMLYENADQICSEVKDNCVVQRFEFELEK